MDFKIIAFKEISKKQIRFECSRFKTSGFVNTFSYDISCFCDLYFYKTMGVQINTSIYQKR